MKTILIKQQMATLKSNMKGELILSWAIEHLLDTVCSEMESALITKFRIQPGFGY